MQGREKYMENITKTYVGVDISKNKFDVYLHPIGKAFSFANSKDGVEKLIAHLSTYTIEQIVCESTGGYENLMLKMLRALGFNVWQVEPNRIKSFIRSKGKKVKTDVIDAHMIALFSAQEMQEHKHIEYGESHELLRDLVKRKKDLVEMIVSERQRLKHPSRVFCKLEIQAHIDFMNKQITEIEIAIEDIIDKDDDLNKKVEIIESVPGIGKATAAMLVAEMPELGKIENKKAAALVGVAPYTQQSGQYKGKSFISGGRAVVRSAIYMAALVASRFNPAMKEFYRRLCDVGKKAPKVALVAVMRKLIIILNVMVKKQTKWNCMEKA